MLALCIYYDCTRAVTRTLLQYVDDGFSEATETNQVHARRDKPFPLSRVVKVAGV